MDLALVLPGHGEPITDHVALIDERLRLHERRAEKIHGLIAAAAAHRARDRPGAVGQRRRHAGLPDALGGARPRRPAARRRARRRAGGRRRRALRRASSRERSRRSRHARASVGRRTPRRATLSRSAQERTRTLKSMCIRQVVVFGISLTAIWTRREREAGDRRCGEHHLESTSERLRALQRPRAQPRGPAHARRDDRAAAGAARPRDAPARDRRALAEPAARLHGRPAGQPRRRPLRGKRVQRQGPARAAGERLLDPRLRAGRDRRRGHRHRSRAALRRRPALRSRARRAAREQGLPPLGAARRASRRARSTSAACASPSAAPACCAGTTCSSRGGGWPRSGCSRRPSRRSCRTSSPTPTRTSPNCSRSAACGASAKTPPGASGGCARCCAKPPASSPSASGSCTCASTSRCGARSLQRAALDIDDEQLTLHLWPGELKPQAEQLYTAGRAERLSGAARKRRPLARGAAAAARLPQRADAHARLPHLHARRGHLRAPLAGRGLVARRRPPPRHDPRPSCGRGCCSAATPPAGRRAPGAVHALARPARRAPAPLDPRLAHLVLRRSRGARRRRRCSSARSTRRSTACSASLERAARADALRPGRRRATLAAAPSRSAGQAHATRAANARSPASASARRSRLSRLLEQA